MISPAAFLTHSLVHHPRGEMVTRILAAAIHAVEPGNAVRRHVQRGDGNLIIAGQNYALADYRRIHILGLGKASHAMASSLPGLLEGSRYRGLLIAKHDSVFPDGFEQVLGGHPVPNQDSVHAGQMALEFLAGVQADDRLLCLISGGGSALMTAPVNGVTLGDMQLLTTLLLKGGARVDEINTLRRHLDQLKGGGVARIVSPARVVSLILSDVVGNPLEAIASGVTAPDPTSREDALLVIEKYGLGEKVPARILQALQDSPETPKPGDKIFEKVQNELVGSNLLAAQAALQVARAEGMDGEILQTDLQGEARQVARDICNILRAGEFAHARPFCLIAGGETTVTVRGHGRGGRNQELALACVDELSTMQNVMIVSLATDGEDGPTDAAGAVVTDQTWARGKALGLSSVEALAENDSYKYFDALGDLLKPGPTGTNVNDLIFAFAF